MARDKKMPARNPLVDLAHDSARTHVIGKSEFIDDRPVFKNELFIALALSTHAHAHFKIENAEEVTKLSGIKALFTANDLHHNVWGTIFQDQPILADRECNYVGEPLAIIAGESEEALKLAKATLKISYQKLPAILSIDQARAAGSFLGHERKIECGNVDKVFKSAKNILEGFVEIAGAEHFYLEPQSAQAIPGENGTLDIWSSSQHPTEVQHVISHALGIESNQVCVTVKRMGGGFGGKESQSAPIAAYAALVAHKLGRPARIILNREDDMAITGKRNPFKNFYKLAYNNQGKFLALEMKLFSDAGAYADLSTSIMERAMLHSDSAYYFSNMRVIGKVCRTHVHPHTAFRGFGAPKGVIVVERLVEEVAHRLKMDPLKIRQSNCYQGKKNVAHYGQKIENNCLPELFKKIEKTSKYQLRRKEIALKNKSSVPSSNLVHGISITPVKFGISFTTRFLNQGNALINIYRDGSVQVSTGATEMGQGTYRRISQIVADEMGIPLEMVRVMFTSTEKNANTSPTAASSGTDINGAAAALACQQIKARLSSFVIELFKLDPKRWASLTAGIGTEAEITVEQHAKPQSLVQASNFKNVEFKDGWVKLRNSKKKIRFQDLCNEAYLNRVSLCDYAHYSIPGLGYDKTRGQGKGAFLYYTQGAACSEVSVDLLTGETKLIACDILMDLGRPINRGLDVGQVAGAFVQGYGWMALEKLFYSADGALKSLGPSTYKIPSIHDIPRKWKIDLLNNGGNVKNVRATKAVGEPPLLLAISAWTAIQNALSYLPQFQSTEQYPALNVPADPESILRKIYPEDFKNFELQKGL